VDQQSQRYKLGWETLGKINSQAGERILKLLEEISPDMARFVIEYPYGDIYSRQGLDIKIRELITIASLTTLGYAKDQLRAHIHNALNANCSKEEITEVLLQMSVYAGFPAALTAMMVAKDVFKEKGLIPA